MDIFYVPVEPGIEEESFRNLLAYVSEEKRRSVNSFRLDIDKKLSLYSELLVRVMACRELGLRNDEIEFGRGKYGKPFLKGHPGFYFNISHTRNAIAAAFSDHEVGIDIERIRGEEREIAKRFFTFEEYEYIYKEETAQDRRFFEIWTKKEAYLKCIGKGLLQPLDSFSVLRQNPEYPCRGFERDGYMISVCGAGAEESGRITERSERELEESGGITELSERELERQVFVCHRKIRAL